MKGNKQVKKIYINPKLPSFMDGMKIEDRSNSHLKKWFNRPYIQEIESDSKVYFRVRILDGGAWDRTTNKGTFNTLDEALKVAKSLL